MKGFGPWVEEGRWKGDVDDVLPSAGYVAQGPSGFAVHPEAGRRSDIPGPFFLSDFPGGFVNLISSLKAPPIVPNRWNPGYGSFGPRTWLSGPMGPCMWLIG